MFSTLHDFIDALDRTGNLKRITEPVSSILEIAEIADRESKSTAPTVGTTGPSTDPLHAHLGGSALLFDHVVRPDGARSSFPLAINLFGSYHRMEMAIGCDETGPAPGGFHSIAQRMAELTHFSPPSNLSGLISTARRYLPLLRLPPRRVRRGLCQEIVHTGTDVNLFDLPMIKCWPLDGDPTAVGFPVPSDQPDTSTGCGRFITLGAMITIHADDADHPRPASRNLGMYRAQLIDQQHLAMHWHMHHDGAAHWRSWKRSGAKRMPVAIALGGESVLPYAATAPLPPGVSELLMAGFLNHGSIKLVRCQTVPLDVPANAEIVIEGWVSCEAGSAGYDSRCSDDPLGPGAVLEGPFGDHTGFYSLPDRYPIMEVTAITHRRDAIYPTTIVGLPPQEDYYMGKATERLFLPLLRTLIPDIADYDLPLFGCFHNCVFIAIDKQYPLQAHRVMHAVWGAGQMAWTKVIVVVDESVDVHDQDAVLSALMQHCRFDQDVELAIGPLDILDHAAPSLGAGGKIGFDATKKMEGEGDGLPVDLSEVSVQSSEQSLRRLLDNLPYVIGLSCPGAMRGRGAIVQIDKSKVLDSIKHPACELGDRLTEQSVDSPAFFILIDTHCRLDQLDDVFFHWCANTDPGRDILRVGRSIIFDATRKSPGEITCTDRPVRDFPPLVEMCDEIKERVSSRWPYDMKD